MRLIVEGWLCLMTDWLTHYWGSAISPHFTILTFRTTLGLGREPMWTISATGIDRNGQTFQNRCSSAATKITIQSYTKHSNWYGLCHSSTLWWYGCRQAPAAAGTRKIAWCWCGNATINIQRCSHCTYVRQLDLFWQFTSGHCEIQILQPNHTTTM